jgi:hypothetical protein
MAEDLPSMSKRAMPESGHSAGCPTTLLCGVASERTCCQSGRSLGADGLLEYREPHPRRTPRSMPRRASAVGAAIGLRGLQPERAIAWGLCSTRRVGSARRWGASRGPQSKCRLPLTRAPSPHFSPTALQETREPGSFRATSAVRRTEPRNLSSAPSENAPTRGADRALGS